MTVKLPPWMGPLPDGTDTLSVSQWEEGPDTVEDLLGELGPFNSVAEQVNALKDLMRTPQWNDFSRDLRDETRAWVGEHGG